MGADVTKVGDYSVEKEDRQKPLGKGTFGAVYKGKHIKKGFLVAIKQCIVHSDGHGSMAMKEIKNFQKIPHHKHIVRMYDYDYLEKSFWIVMEYCDRGDLDGYMKKYVPNLDRQLKIMYQCACAVSHLHSQEEPIVHRDIKPQNILFKKEDGKEVVKIADFGLTRAMEKGTHKGAVGMKTQAGTVAFMAPEILAGATYDQSVDTFAMGLLFLAMINFKATDEYMFPLAASSMEKEDLSCVGQDMLQAALGKEPSPTIVKLIATDSVKMKGIKKLIRDIVKYEPDERIGMTEVVERLRNIADGSADPGSMVSGTTAARARLSLSNMSLAQTRGGDLMSTMGGRDLKTVVAKKPELATVLDEEDESEEVEEKDENDKDDESMEVDLGYLLMRRMLEDAVRHKKEEQIPEAAARARAEDEAAMLPLLALMKLMQSDSETGSKFEVGDRVKVDKDLARAKDLQTGHGGWAPGMEKYLDEEGQVKEIKGNIVNIRFANGQSLRYNAMLLTKLRPSGKSSPGKLVKGKFKRLDIVKFKATESQVRKAQEGHGEWNDRMTNCLNLRGVVHRVFDDGDVYVEFLNGDKWCVNPDGLQLVDTSAIEIEAGDLVLVLDDKEKVKALQKGHGEWVEDMAQCLGVSGIVRKVGINDVAVVEISSTKWTWNTKALRPVAKGEEMVMIMLRKQLLA